MKRPREAFFDQNRETSTLFFRDHDDSAEFFLRGGVYWPSADSNGFVVLAGQEVLTNKIWVFREAEFQTVEDITQDGQIRLHGVNHFFNRSWSKYFCRLTRLARGRRQRLWWATASSSTMAGPSLTVRFGLKKQIGMVFKTPHRPGGSASTGRRQPLTIRQASYDRWGGIAVPRI